MQLSKISLISLLLASFSSAISLEEVVKARDVALVKAASEVAQKRNLEIRTPKKKGKGGGSDDDYDGDDDDDDENSGASVHINMILAAGAGTVAVAAMML
ncbi:hypothetical protein TWF481_000140 [Arthrobotrys musiformis]|uniref:Uncharacterized protein n=1 Tax=Arthrobotrys musiformis TaxID=47236 RepID=A0AAV9WMM0_9PEZI